MARLSLPLLFGIATLLPSIAAAQTPTLLLPPPEDVPEEVLRAEIYAEARSPIDGEPLTATEYAELQEDMAETIANLPPEMLVSDEVREIIQLLRLRKLLKTLIPFF